jgi:hypothetical protein
MVKATEAGDTAGKLKAGKDLGTGFVEFESSKSSSTTTPHKNLRTAFVETVADPELSKKMLSSS